MVKKRNKEEGHFCPSKMSKSTRQECHVSSFLIFSPLFITAIGYLVVLRLLDFYIMVTSSGVVWYGAFWIDPVIGFISIGDIIVTTAFGLWVFSIIDLRAKLKCPNTWLTMLTCLLLVLYTLGICLRARYFAGVF